MLAVVVLNKTLCVNMGLKLLCESRMLLIWNEMLSETRGDTIYRYIYISQYTKNLYRIAIRNSYRNISQFFFLPIKQFMFHSILVLKQLQVQKVYTCQIYTLIKRSLYSHVCMFRFYYVRFKIKTNIEKLIIFH